MGAADRSGRILIADDEPHVVAYVRAVLELGGFDIVGEAGDADTAVRMADELRPDLAILDLRMPGGGLSAARMIPPLSPETRIVVFTAEDDGHDIVPLLRSGIDGYIVKGCSPEHLIDAIRSVVSGGTYLSPAVSRVAMRELTTRLHAEQLDELREDRRRSAIADTIAARRFRTVVQPIVTVDGGEPHAAEALTRFTGQPARAPDAWFREAEVVGLQVPLELATASGALAELPKLRSTVRLTVNLSPTTVLSPRLGEILTTAPLDRVVIELTEHERVADYAAVAAALAPWRAKGARLAVDDAGGGYASFSHILNLAPEYIKLDMNLTASIHEDRQRQALARAVIGFAHEMGVAVIAEAVETAPQLDALAALGIHYVQGYHVGRPLPVDEQPLLLADSAGGPDRSVDLRPMSSDPIRLRRS
jgi:EAL domain-containing protein (putative c-di-GMP-specific phosphodiesterase class I)/AmiR/NasT family two-component response regulator